MQSWLLLIKWRQELTELGKCTYKVPNGKLIKVMVEFENENIIKVQITGDFFIHPEESIDDLELALKETEYSRKNVSDIVSWFFSQDDLVAFGITPKAVVDAVMKCKETNS
jgi:lipoate-protein ligase A